MTAYGNVDLSIDDITKGIAGKLGPDGSPPVGRVGWLPDVSTNLSYIGVRGFQTLDGLPFKLIYQLETQMDVAATSGTGETNSTDSNVVKGALTSRNSFIGLASAEWGAIMIGKTDAPYKVSTARMNPFFGMISDYQSIMGNTGGDNRVEFGTRLDHSIWYESPKRGGFVLDVLYSPGKNRADNSDNIAAGESDCTGGNVPGSGGITPVTCSDGSFSDAVSGSLSYSRDSLYITAAYERHMRVNRSEATSPASTVPATRIPRCCKVGMWRTKTPQRSRRNISSRLRQPLAVFSRRCIATSRRTWNSSNSSGGTYRGSREAAC